MNAAPLVLYRADAPTPAEQLSIQGAVRLLRERHPGAEVRAREAFGEMKCRHWPRPVWLLSVAPAGWQPTGDVHAIDPTPTASVAMQVWRGLGPCPHCDTANWKGCFECDDKHRLSPPWWLRYLDDAACGRLSENSEDAAMWVAVQSYEPDAQLGQIRRAGESDAYRLGLVTEGGAILRDRGRRIVGLESSFREATDGLQAEVDRLRTERDALRDLPEVTS